MRSSLDWRRVAEGINLVGFGAFLLATTLGTLPWSFWLDALALWPILIVSLGIRVAFDRSRAPWIVLLSPLVTLGALGWIAHGARFEVPVREWSACRAERPKEAQSLTFEAQLFRSRIDLEARALTDDLLVEGRSGWRRERGRFEIRADDHDPRVRISTGSIGAWSAVTGPQQRWELGLTEALPVRLRLRGAMNRGLTDLGRGRVSEVEIEGAFNDFELRLPRPEGAVRVRARGAFNNLHLVVPRGTAVRVHADSPFNVVDQGSATRAESGADGPGYEVRIEGAFSRLVIDEN